MSKTQDKLEKSEVHNGCKYDSFMENERNSYKTKYLDNAMHIYPDLNNTSIYESSWDHVVYRTVYHNFHSYKININYSRTSFTYNMAYDFDFSLTICKLNISYCRKYKPISQEQTMIMGKTISSVSKTELEDFKDTRQVTLPCSLLKNMSRNALWYTEMPANVSLLVKENNISSFKCIFKKDHFYKCATESKLSLMDYLSMSCLQDDGTIQKVIKSSDHVEVMCKNVSQQIVYMFITFCIFIFIFVVCICRKFKLLYAFQNKFQLFTRKEKKGHAYKFDAFISYSHFDIDWVLQFYSKLKGLGHNICFDEKDFLVGAFISDNIHQAFRESHKVIFIVTEHFIESTWGEFELAVARTYALENGRHNMIIVVLKDDVDIERMPKVLKNMWYEITCIKWYTTKDFNIHENKCIRKVHKALSG
ncbi:Hypothetical predicted protein [Mytilus galloprovincialis]|uniref:TIR domain-containing protein n=1 Tax=Mytilus galloprovincialis TaxID=29158 RepID=A0A8B6F9F5_MYTGA|nr:Hypothetical predicted protein [Mytilus galloprovincialis]